MSGAKHRVLDRYVRGVLRPELLKLKTVSGNYRPSILNANRTSRIHHASGGGGGGGAVAVFIPCLRKRNREKLTAENAAGAICFRRPRISLRSDSEPWRSVGVAAERVAVQIGRFGDFRERFQIFRNVPGATPHPLSCILYTV